MFYSVLVLIFSVIIMRRCSSSFDIAANYLTRGLGEGIKGPTINAIASSLPELLISSMFLFYFRNIEGFSAGFATIVGSSAFNIALIPIISFLYVSYINDTNKKFHINKLIVKQDTLFLLGSILILFLGFNFGINLFFAICLISFYLIYIYFVIKTRNVENSNGAFLLKFIRSNKVKVKKDNLYVEDFSFFKSLVHIKLFKIFFNGKVNSFTSTIVVFFSVIIIGVSCYLLVGATEHISNYFGINLFFGAFLIAAIASSIPDTIFSVQDAIKDKFNDSFSNAYGSNIFDICIGIGFPVLVYTLMYGPINLSIQIERIGFLGDFILEGNLFYWSLIVLSCFTIIISFIYYKIGLKLGSSLIILLLYLLFIFLLLIF